MNMGKRTLVIVVVAAVVLGGAVLAVMLGSTDEVAIDEDPPEVRETESAEDDDMEAFEEALAELMGPADSESPRRRQWDRPERTPEERAARTKRRDERREARRLAWEQATPEERQARLARRMQIVTDSGEPYATPLEEVAEVMREVRPQIRDCMRENGGFRGLRELMRGDGGVGRGGFTTNFTIAADGSVDASSIGTDPPLPAAFASCLTSAISAAEFPETEEESASVEIQMDRGGRGRRNGGAGNEGAGNERGQNAPPANAPAPENTEPAGERTQGGMR